MEPGSEAWMTLNRMGNAFEAAQEDEVAHPTGFNLVQDRQARQEPL